ncbi:MAG: ribbon-helix-helix protein, CopG family [Rhodospirillales bacterium]|nr:ribbon-helix-helix protein, CopG family [Rhodospirillales bacterium]
MTKSKEKVLLKRRPGRPATGVDPLVTVRLPAEMIAALDQRAAAEAVSRSEIIRRFCGLGLAKGKGR